MYTLHLFDSAEDHYDCCCGATPTHTVTFVSEEASILWLQQEFGDEHPYISTPDELEEQRKERISLV
jgi:hypothetical protein